MCGCLDDFTYMRSLGLTHNRCVDYTVLTVEVKILMTGPYEKLD